MNAYTGEILSGEMDRDQASFYLTEVKSMETRSEVSLKQLKLLWDYVVKQEDTFMLTINDQIPILLNNEEVTSLLDDISKIIKTLES